MAKYFTFTLSIIFFSFGCGLESPDMPIKENQYNLIPLPTELSPMTGQFIRQFKLIN